MDQAEISIPPMYAVSQVEGYIKGKSAIHLARAYSEPKRNFVRQHFWARGYLVSRVDRNEAVIRAYVQNQMKYCRTPAPASDDWRRQGFPRPWANIRHNDIPSWK